MPNIQAIQAALRASKIDGWLFYDHHHRDAIAGAILGLNPHALVTRRWFYFIPAKGEPRKLVHRIESVTLDSVPGKKEVYSGWEELHKGLKKLLSGGKKIAMQYSPENNIPYIGLVDAGTEGREADGASGVERDILDSVGEDHADADAIGVGVDEGVGPVPERQRGFVDPVPGQVLENPLDHGPATNGEHLLGSGQGEGP